VQNIAVTALVSQTFKQCGVEFLLGEQESQGSKADACVRMAIAMQTRMSELKTE
jgi:hypothetical protein